MRVFKIHTVELIALLKLEKATLTSLAKVLVANAPNTESAIKTAVDFMHQQPIEFDDGLEATPSSVELDSAVSYGSVTDAHLWWGCYIVEAKS